MSTASWIQPPCRYYWYCRYYHVIYIAINKGRTISASCSERYLPDRGGFSKRSRSKKIPSVVVSASSSSSSSSSSCSCGSSEILNFDFGSRRSWNHQGLSVQTMSATAQRNFSLSKSGINDKNEPDHLLVLVHGILARLQNLLRHHAVPVTGST